MIALHLALGIGLGLTAAAPDEPGEAAEPKLLSVRKIWDAAPHNAFTDLVRHEGYWYCAFREGQGHVSPDGALQVIISQDGEVWRSRARRTLPDADLRDAKLSVMPDGRLLLLGAGAMHPPSKVRHQTFAWIQESGDINSTRFSDEPIPIGEPNFWLWRITWHEDRAYGLGYGTTPENRFVRLYRSPEGFDYKPLVPRLFDQGYPNESSIVFLPDGTALCLLRRDEGPATGLLGTARAPYTEWSWKDLGVRIGGPHLLRLPDGRLVAGVRLYEPRVRTGLAWLDPEKGTLTEFLTLPSGGDTSYPGLAWHEDQLWVSYYSSHEGKANIYLARVALPDPTP